MQIRRTGFHTRFSILVVSIAIPLLLLVVSRGSGEVRGAEEEAEVRNETSDTTIWFPMVAKGWPGPRTGSTGPQYGVVFMSSAEAPADEAQYQNALSTGATWNRWPIYWPLVERSEGNFDWSAQDGTILADVAHGLRLDAILLGTPSFYQTGLEAPTPQQLEPRPEGRVTLFAPERATPEGLYKPVFSDGSDVPGQGKTINGNNRWARFVYSAVKRYMPGGTLAQQHRWPANVGVRHWEMWNEPELASFWDGSLADYARLLKVGYLAAKHADPQAQVLFGALANFARPSFYDEVLSIYDGDALAQANGYFHDILATHNYAYAWRSWEYVFNNSNAMNAHGLQKPIWLNESGVRAWNDYPGPVWDPESAFSATMSEQADFVIQSAFYATFAGADAIFHFQLYDGCGNQPAGTDFPPHNGELCDANGRLISDPRFPCAGDANGLFRNPPDATCFTQHPNPESPRPNYAAFRVLTTHLRDVTPLWRRRPGDDDGNPYTGPQEWIAFFRPATRQRIIGMWARFGDDQIANVPAIAGQATLVAPDGSTQTIRPQNGTYRVPLPGATNQNLAWDRSIYAIGGRPYILIETDLQAPTATISAALSGADRDGLAMVEWGGDDGSGSGVAAYTVTVAVDGGAPRQWMANTSAGEGQFAMEAGHTYVFSVTARDIAGNVSPAVETAVEVDGETE